MMSIRQRLEELVQQYEGQIVRSYSRRPGEVVVRAVYRLSLIHI